MPLSCGIVGLPNVGKSTLFNAFLKRQIAQVGEYPYTTIEPNVGVVEVPDERLTLIADRLTLPKIVPAAIKFIDIAGLIRGAHKGEGLGNQFLAHIREVDAIIHVVRAFENQQVEHVHGKIDPEEEVETVSEELKLGGIDKPTIYVINVSEKDLTSTSSIRISEVISKQYRATAILFCAKLEAELSDLSEKDQQDYLKELGVDQSGLDQVIKESYKLLDLITFFTIVGGKLAPNRDGSRQVQSWPIKSGSKIIEAAGIVHTDFAKGFIVAETIPWQELTEVASWQNAKDKGLIKTVGRDEKVSDGMVVEFKFRV